MSDRASLWAEDTYDRNPVLAAAPEEPQEMAEDLGELVVADYLVFLFALDTFMRYIEERTGIAPDDDSGLDADLDQHLRKGLALLRRADALAFHELDHILREGLTSPGAIKMLDVVMKTLPTARGAGTRSLRLRTLLTRGGTGTTKRVFDKNPRARREVMDAIEAAMMVDADAALAKFAVITLKNKLLGGWIDRASDLAVPLDAVAANPVHEAVKKAAEQTDQLRTSSVIKDGTDPASEKVPEETQKEQVSIQKIETDAREVAQKILQKTGEEDRPVTKSEAIGIATAAAAAIVTDPTSDQNIPEPLRKLDPEQRAASLTDGRVLVAAGAGSGKSTTLVARVNYLVQDRKISPSRIFVTSFNAKAANELKYKISKAVGEDNFKSMSVGTMHSLFRRFITEYGTPAEKGMMNAGFVQTGSMVAGAVNRAWSQCYPDDDTPKVKDMMRFKSIWAGNGISPAEAKQQAKSEKERVAAEWYEWYEGFKGSIPGWRPTCRVPPKEWETFMNRRRPGGIQLGDFDNMLSVFRDILKREPGVRKTVQKMFDHLLVDECQDLSKVQFDIIQMMSEHISDGSDGKSLWMVGDDKQSIYGFRGAKPEMFIALDGAPGWKTRSIRTNYRCQPEIVEAANKLISHNEDQIKMDANPDARKTRGVASIRVQAPLDDASAAIAMAREIKLDLQSGGDVADNAVLTRTNKELHAFETACIIKGIPYARKGASSFFGSPETTAVLSYIQLVTGDDSQKMQNALAQVINRPNRFFVGPDQATAAVEGALSDYARRTRMDRKGVSPVAALEDPSFRRDLAARLSGAPSGFKFNKAVETLDDFARELSSMRANASDPDSGYTMKDLFTDILNFRGITSATDARSGRTNYVEQTFRASLQADLKNATGDDDDDTEEEEDIFAQGLGNVAFLFELSQADPDDPDDASNDPGTPMGFRAKMERYAARMRDLRIDINKWEKEQQALPPDKRSPPPGVYLGTVHCSPPDEPILTTDGWVQIKDLDPTTHRLASYIKTCNQLFWGKLLPDGQGHSGYPFIKDLRPYKGTLVTIKTENSRTRVTAEHRVLARFAESFLDKWVVYLMRRGEWWRLGVCVSARRPYRGAGVGGRLGTEKANAGWVLGVFNTKEEALVEEARLQGIYGIPGLTFEASKARSLTSNQLHMIHESIKDAVTPRALTLLKDFNLNEEWPLYIRGEKDKKNNFQKSFVLRACNLLDGYMEVPVVTDSFVAKNGTRDNWMKPEWRLAQVGKELWQGSVYSLTVTPHRFYVSGGAIVHNSVKGAQWKNVYVSMPKGKFPFEPRVKPGEPPMESEEIQKQMEQERRLAYVAITRPINNLTVMCPSQVGGKAAGMSPFVHEAGLNVVGENVPKETEVTKEASTYLWSLPKGAHIEIDSANTPLSDLEHTPDHDYSYGR